MDKTLLEELLYTTYLLSVSAKQCLNISIFSLEGKWTHWEEKSILKILVFVFKLCTPWKTGWRCFLIIVQIDNQYPLLSTSDE